MTPGSSKREVRQTMLVTLRAMSPEQRALSSAELRAALIPYLQAPQPLRIGLYLPMRHEVDLRPLLQEYPQHHFAAPRCHPGGKMEFHRIRDIARDTEPGKHGILAPLASMPIIPPQQLDILLIPGIAFTAQGARLGYGGGYYDRYIPRCTRARKIAPAFCCQQLPQLPTDAHDIRIPHIIFR